MSKQLANIYHNLALMVEAGVPIKRGLQTAAGGTRRKYVSAFEGLAKSIAKGNTITESMSAYPKVFDPLDVMVVEAGETSGELAACLNHLSAWYTFRNRFKNIICQGLILPVIVLHLGALVMPLPNVFLAHLSLSGYLSQVFSTLTIFYVPFIIILLIKKFGPQGSFLRQVLDEISIHIPILRKVVLALGISRFTNAFCMLYSAGIPITICTQKACEITANSAVVKLFQGGIASSRGGNEVSKGFSRELPEDYIASWEVGEETGQLDKVTRRLAIQTQERAEMMITELATWLPRIAYWIVCIMLIWGIFKGYSKIYGNLGNF
jgi:type II secretory pathway component PulF